MIQSIGFGTFIFFGAFSLLSLGWTWFFCPETKGRTLEEMDALFKSRTAHDELEAKHDIIQAICRASATGGISPRSIESEKDVPVHVEGI